MTFGSTGTVVEATADVPSTLRVRQRSRSPSPQAAAACDLRLPLAVCESKRAARIDEIASPTKPRHPQQPSAEPPMTNGLITMRALTWQRHVRWPLEDRGVEKNPRLHSKCVNTLAHLEALLSSIPPDETRVFVAVAPWVQAQWSTVLGDAAARAALVRDAVVDAFLVDVDAVPEATELLAITTSQLPSAHSFHSVPPRSLEEASATSLQPPVKRKQAVLSAPIDLVSLLCIQPAHDLAHLHRILHRAPGSVVTYSGATWCPPCCRIMPQVPTMARDINATLTAKGHESITVVKIDRDACPSLDLLNSVKLIPTFQVYRAPCVTAGSVPAAVAALPASLDDATDARFEAARRAAARPLEALQSSQCALVTAFLERLCLPMTFDDEF